MALGFCVSNHRTAGIVFFTSGDVKMNTLIFLKFLKSCSIWTEHINTYFHQTNKAQQQTTTKKNPTKPQENQSPSNSEIQNQKVTFFRKFWAKQW